MGPLVRLLGQPLTLLLLPVAGFGAILLGHRWIPIHDTLQVTQLTHMLWSSLAYAREFPAWTPYVSMGKTTALGFVALLPPSIWLLTPLALFYDGWNAVQIMLVGGLLSEALLAVGTYALGSLLFRYRLTALFVSFTVVGTVSWIVQIQFNFLIYYSMPLCLYLAIRGLRERSLWLLQLAVWVFVVTGSIGDSLYPAIMQTVIFAAVVILVAAREGVRPNELLARFGRRETLGLALILAAVLLPIAYLLHPGMPVVTSPGRTAAGRISYDIFLGYQADPRLRTLSGLFTGITLHHDLTTYGGLLLLPLLVVGLMFGTARHQLPLAATTAGVFLFYLAEGSFVAPLLYYVPGVSFYRHLSYVAPHIRFLLVLLAGFGFDEVLRAVRAPAGERRRSVLVLLLMLLAGMALAYAWQTMDLVDRRRVVLGSVGIGVAAVFTARALYCPSWARHLGTVLVIIALVDVFSHRSFEHHRILQRVTDEQWDLFRLRPLVFAPERTLRLENQPAFRQYWPVLFGGFSLEGAHFAESLLGTQRPRFSFRGTRVGMTYDHLESFLGIDACRHLGLTHHLLPWVRELVSPHWSPETLDTRVFGPAPREAFAWATACGHPKLQFFAAGGESPQDADGADHGPVLNLATASREKGRHAAPPGLPVAAAHTVAAFTPNRLEIRLAGPLPEGRWLYYADAWHPLWRAEVDGNPAAVAKANQAFKAVFLPAGTSRIAWKYDARLDTLLAALIWAESALLFGGVAVWLARGRLRFPFPGDEASPSEPA